MANHRIDHFKRVLERGVVGAVVSTELDVDVVKTPSSSSLILTFEDGNYVPLSVIKQTLEQLSGQVSGSSVEESWHTLGWAALSLYGHVVNHLLNQTLPITSGILYWDDVLDSGPLGLAVYGVQIAPFWVYSQAKKVIDGNFDNSGWINGTFSFSSIPFKRIQPRSITELVYMANPAYVSLRKNIKKNRQELIKVRDDAARRLGSVVSQCWIEDEENDVDVSTIIQNNTIKCIKVLYKEIVDDEYGDITSSSLSDYTKLILTTINQLSPDKTRYSTVIDTHGTPNSYTRYWPIAGVAVYGLYKVIGNWQAISTWARTQLWETLVSFYQNRLVKPLYQIYETIRYDENEEVTLISKKSLESDIRSLERMVIDLVQKTDKSISPDILQSRIEQGDLTDVLVHYEKQIQTPVRSIVNGELIRSLLIQVQKAKVDVEVAVSGIDKLLQSQQLVFGLVAALPAVGVTWWVINAFINRTVEGNIQRRVKGLHNIKGEIHTCLYNIKRVLRKGTKQSTPELSPLGLGLLLCQTHLLRDLGHRILTNSRYREFTDDLDEVEIASTISSKQLALDRIYWRNYF